MPGIAPPGGKTVDRFFIPRGTAISVHMWSSTLSSKNLAYPDDFIPEQWLDPNCTDEKEE